jgi:hypothetical protein
MQDFQMIGALLESGHVDALKLVFAIGLFDKAMLSIVLCQPRKQTIKVRTVGHDRFMYYSHCGRRSSIVYHIFGEEERVRLSLY